MKLLGMTLRRHHLERFLERPPCWSLVLAFHGVTRRFGATRALDDVTFALEPGTLTVLAGPNGAGKSTLLRIAATLDAPTSGRVDMASAPVADDGAAARRRIAWLGQEPGLYDDLTVRENLRFVARFFGRTAREEEAAARAFGIDDRFDERARRLSRGQRQRAALARATLAGDMMLLDEPTTALDADGARQSLEALVAMRGARTLLVASHDDAVIARADRVLRLARGRLVSA